MIWLAANSLFVFPNEILCTDLRIQNNTDSMVNLTDTFNNGGDMKELIGKMTASLAREEQSGDDLIAVLNANIKPPEPIVSSAVYIRAMYIVSDQVNSYGGRFPADPGGEEGS